MFRDLFVDFIALSHILPLVTIYQPEFLLYIITAAREKTIKQNTNLMNPPAKISVLGIIDAHVMARNVPSSLAMSPLPYIIES
jgi:hypothetical protein